MTSLHVNEVLDRLKIKNPTSVARHERATRALAMEIVGTVDISCPVYIASVDGACVTDIDGNEYVDLTMGFGPHVLGHRPPAVETALTEQLGKGWHWGVHNDIQIELAELVQEMSPCAEKVVFCNSGTEATMLAIRAARAFSGRSKVAVFDGSYHGVHDYALMVADNTSARSEPTPRRRGAGIPDQVLETVMMLPYNDDSAFDVIRRNADDLALVLVEPVQSSNPREDIGPWLRSLSRACREAGVLFMLDEVITGFRLAPGGGQEYFDVVADLATFGKALGGGLPIGAVAGRADVMSVFGRGTERARPIFSGGTFSGNPLSMIAGVAALTYMKENLEFFDELNERGRKLSRLVNEHAVATNAPVVMMGAGSMFHLRFTDAPIVSFRDVTIDFQETERLFYQLLQERGVLVPGIHLAFISLAHSDADVLFVARAINESIDDLRKAGYFEGMPA